MTHWLPFSLIKGWRQWDSWIKQKSSACCLLSASDRESYVSSVDPPSYVKQATRVFSVPKECGPDHLWMWVHHLASLLTSCDWTTWDVHIDPMSLYFFPSRHHTENKHTPSFSPIMCFGHVSNRNLMDFIPSSQASSCKLKTLLQQRHPPPHTHTRTHC